MRPNISPRHTALVRLGLLLASTSLSVAGPLAAIAQPAPPPGAEQPADLAGQQGTDPPALAGSVSGFAGSVSFHASGETQWTPATLNYPVTSGEGFWTEPQASATLEIADSRLVMDGSTELDVTTLDQSQLLATEAQGALFLQLGTLDQGQSVTINTPRGAVQITATGRYEIVAGDTNSATTITVVEGAAHITGTGLTLDVGPQQTATITGSDTLQGSVGPMQQDAFLEEQLRAATPAPVAQNAAPIPRQVRYMTGGAELASYGTWNQTPQYGQVWYPTTVASNWAPYRDGHWAYVHPWGWTWVDNARWGFAPFHYGRWVQVNNRWGWIAGGGGVEVERVRPVYSPALVSFIGVSGAGIGFSAGVVAGGFAPAWVPLGPREPYYPWYHCRPDYFARVNSPYGVSRTIIERGPTVINNVHETNIFINRRAATVIPAADFARGQPVMRVGRPLPERAFAEARPLVGRMPVRPTAYTPNLPPETARRFNVAVPARPMRAAPGPQIVPATVGERARPELRRNALPPNVRAVPAMPPARPGAAEPARLMQPRPGDVRGPLARPGEPASARPATDRPAPGRPEPGRVEPGRVEPGRVEPGRVEPGRVEPARPAAGRPEPGRAENRLAPALRTPGARPESLQPRPAAPPAPRPAGEAGQARLPAGAAGAPRGTDAIHPVRPLPPMTAEHSRPGASALPQHQAQPPLPGAHPENVRPAPRPPERHEVARPDVNRPPPHTEAARPAPHVETSRPGPRSEAPRPAPRAEMPRAEMPRAEMPRAEMPRAEMPRPATRPEPARPAPRPEAPRPPPHAEAPHPEAPHPGPHAEAPRPAQHPEPHDRKPPQTH